MQTIVVQTSTMRDELFPCELRYIKNAAATACNFCKRENLINAEIVLIALYNYLNLDVNTEYIRFSATDVMTL